jgi:hypothetical protein
MSYQYVCVWTTRKGNQFFKYFHTWTNAKKWADSMIPKIRVYQLVGE